MSTPKKKLPMKRIAHLIAQHARLTERGRAAYSKAGEKLDKALALAVPMGEPIPMPDGRTVIVRDQFATSNRAFTSAAVKRYVVEPYRPDKDRLPTRPRRASTSDQPIAPGTEQI